MWKGSKEFTSPSLETETDRYTKRKVQAIVKRRLTTNACDLRRLNPFCDFFNAAAFFFSSDVRTTAPMSASLKPKNALYTFLMIYHHDGKMYIEMKLRAKK
mmetsp:Transcript_15205/g.22353  ORF Transcript_15205/g.22353 Transcript_15205/m.22353 type:complete len:101 (-) Transcript_15205:228-530(-)